MDLQEEITKFKNDVGLKHNISLDNLVYLRLSSLDNSIKSKDAQIKDALNKLRADLNSLLNKYSNLEEQGFKLFVEVKSAYKNSERSEFIKLYNQYLFVEVTSVRDLLDPQTNFRHYNLYITNFDRISRVFFYSLTFQLLRILRGINIYSLDESQNNLEREYNNVKESDNNKQLLYIFQLMISASSASKHSEDFSNKVKKRVSKKNGVTISNKTGKKWGASSTISDKVKASIKDLYKRFTAEQIAQHPKVFQTIKGKRERVSVHTIRKIVRE